MQWNGTPRRAIILALLAAAACDGGTTGPAAPASLIALTATTQNTVVGAPAPVPPAVRVSDEQGQGLEGVQVAFAVTGGQGSVSASSVTDAGGVAVAQGWTMGTVAEENVLTASVAGVAPVVFRATAAPGAAATLQKAGGDGQSATVGTVLADSIGVRVVDSFGNGVPGQQVNFTTTSGTLSAPRVTTGARGYARVSLGVPIRPGAIQVRAGSGVFEPLTFAVTVAAGVVATITPVAGDGQSAVTGTAVPVPPAVRLTDSYGNAVRGRPVTFIPGPGNGVVMGGAAVSDSTGRAQVVSWVLGTPGTNRLNASVAGVPAIVVFTATSTVPCGSLGYTLYATVSGVLLPNRCTVSWRNAELYSFTVTTQQCVDLRMSSSEFDTYLYLLDGAGNVLAENDDSGGGYNSLIRRHLAPGSYSLGAAAFAGGTGAFQLTSARVPADQPCSSFQAVQGSTPGKTR
jgi:hypothetical protein